MEIKWALNRDTVVLADIRSGALPQRMSLTLKCVHCDTFQQAVGQRNITHLMTGVATGEAELMP